jgi:hypothetical protein
MASPTISTIKRTSARSAHLEMVTRPVLVIAGPVLLLGLLEGTAYLWERDQAQGTYAWELVASRRIELEFHSRPGAGYTLMKPGSRYRWRTISVQINSHGLRGPETTYQKPPNTLRILSLGDSVAMGWGVREEETYSRRLETLLNRKEAGNRKYEVVNAGTPAWNLDNELSYLQAEGLKYSPDILLLDLTIVNDIYGGSALEAERPALIEWLRAKTYFWPFLTVQMRWLEARAKGRNRIPVIDPPKDPAAYYPLDLESPRWAVIWDRIQAMRHLAEENGSGFLLILFPLEFQVLDDNYSRAPQLAITRRAASARVPALDLLPAYREACLGKPGGPCQLEDRYLFADVWMHPSVLGHEVAAAQIEASLKEWFKARME